MLYLDSAKTSNRGNEIVSHGVKADCRCGLIREERGVRCDVSIGLIMAVQHRSPGHRRSTISVQTIDRSIVTIYSHLYPLQSSCQPQKPFNAPLSTDLDPQGYNTFASGYAVAVESLLRPFAPDLARPGPCQTSHIRWQSSSGSNAEENFQFFTIELKR
jgi:hypothetical protein